MVFHASNVVRACLGIALCVAMVASSPDARAQSAAELPAISSTGPARLVDSLGNTVGRPLTDNVVLITLERDVATPASIRAVYDPNGRMASGLALWQSGGSVLFTSPDCTTGAYVNSGALAGVRAATQVQTRTGIVLYAGAIGMPSTVDVRSILYDSGCSPISVRQSGLFPVLATLNLSATYPPPLAYR